MGPLSNFEQLRIRAKSSIFMALVHVMILGFAAYDVAYSYNIALNVITIIIEAILVIAYLKSAADARHTIRVLKELIAKEDIL